jgi:hypothetical protein
MMPTYARQLIRLTGKDKIVQALQGAWGVALSS